MPEYSEEAYRNSGESEEKQQLSEFASKNQVKAIRLCESPYAAIKAKCRDCTGGSFFEVRKCNLFDCSLYPYRFGDPDLDAVRQQLETESEGVEFNFTNPVTQPDEPRLQPVTEDDIRRIVRDEMRRAANNKQRR